MIAPLVVGSLYLALWLLTARKLYAHWREAPSFQRVCPEHDRPGGYASCCWVTSQPPWPDGSAATLAVVFGSVWWAVAFVALVRWRPPPTAAEKAATRLARDQRIAVLQAEVDRGARGE